MSNIYEEILENINADTTAWCKHGWDDLENGNGKISRCLVSHVDYATGVSYLKPDGKGGFKRFVSKSMSKWRKRNEVLRHLVESMTPKMREASGYSDESFAHALDAEEQNKRLKGDHEYRKATLAADPSFAKAGYNPVTGWQERVDTPASNVLVEFNDAGGVTKAQVKTLLKRAAKRFPED